jgi:hypothetical protein
MENTTISTTAQEGLAPSNPYRYAYAHGMLHGEIGNLEMELKFGRDRDILKAARKLVALAARIREELDNGKHLT